MISVETEMILYFLSQLHTVSQSNSELTFAPVGQPGPALLAC